MKHSPAPVQWDLRLIIKGVHARLHLHAIRYLLDQITAQNPAALDPSSLLANPFPLYSALAVGDLRLVRCLISRGFACAPEKMLERSFSDEIVTPDYRVPNWIAKHFNVYLSPDLCRRLIRWSWRAIAWLVARGVDLNGIKAYRNVFFSVSNDLRMAVDQVLPLSAFAVT